jgi:hypothetical protein
MRLITSFLSIVAGSHFRSGSFQFSQTADKDNDLILTRTLNYRRGFSGYTPACWQSHVLKGKHFITYTAASLRRTADVCHIVLRFGCHILLIFHMLNFWKPLID